MKLWEQQENESDWDFFHDIASLVLVIVFVAVVALALFGVYLMVVK